MKTENRYMIVDCHTHIWTSVQQLGAGAAEYLLRQAGREGLAAGGPDHTVAAACAGKTLVLGFRSAYLGADVPNDLIGTYVSRQGDSMIGIGAVDPTEKNPSAVASELLDRPEFRGLTVSPALQNFHPADSSAMSLYELAARRGAPVFFYQGTHFPQLGRMEYARPYLLDEIAREFPDLTIVISSMGHPWIEECLALIGKHPRVFADLAGLIRRPWLAYNALVLAHQFNVTDKILFGSDFPFFTAAQAVESIYRLHEVAQGGNLPTVPREILRSIVERDSLGVLGIARPGETAAKQAVEDDEEMA